MPLDSSTPASAPAETPVAVGPANASLQVKTYREGIAQKVGHDLVIDVTNWQGQVSASSVAIDADSSSLQVSEGHNGVKPLSDKDRAEIAKNIDGKVLQKQPISFRSTQVARNGDTLTVQGNLSIGTTTRPVECTLSVAGGRVKGIVPLVQRDFGIKPYSAMMGALKVRDDIEIVIDAPLS